MRKSILIPLVVFSLLFSAINTQGQFSQTSSAGATICWPQNWWVGMKTNRVLLVIQGARIGLNTAEISYPGVSIVKQFPGEDRDISYLFVEIEILPTAQPGDVPIQIMNSGKVASTHNFVLNQREKNINPPQLNGADVIYQILPDRFANGDPSNDNIPGFFERAERTNPSGIHGGDIAGIIKNINYIEQLGATAVELTPLYESNQLVQSYDKFAPTNNYSIDPHFGSMNDLTQMIHAFQTRNMKVILTQVLNKIGNQHPFALRPPKRDWIHPRPLTTMQPTAPNPVIFSDPYASKEDLERHSTVWESFDTPALNQSLDEVRRFIVQNVIWWIESTGVDGIKIEKLHLNSPLLIKELCEAINSEYPQLNVIGSQNAGLVVHNYYSKEGLDEESYFSHVTDMPLYKELLDAFANYQNTNESLMGIYKTIASDMIYEDPSNQLVIPGDGHDMTRLFTLAEKDPAIYRMYMGFLLTVRGIPSFLYGSEIQMEGMAFEGNGFLRGDFPGGWPDDQVNIFEQTGLSPKQKEAYKFMSILLAWRKANPELMRSKTIHFEPRDDIYAYFRYTDNKKLLVIINNNQDSPRRIETFRFAATTGKFDKVFNIITNEVTPGLGSIVLNPKGIVILELTSGN